MEGMSVVVDLLKDNLATPLAGVCYIIAACIFVWGMGTAAYKVVGDDHHTMRSVMPQVTLTAIASGIMVLVAANISAVMN